MANVASAVAALLRSGKYSDFTLVCEGKEFRVHKCIVCAESPVIAAALKNGFKEAETDTMTVNFGLTALNCMLLYMYTGDYKEEPVEAAQPIQFASTNEIGQQVESLWFAEGADEPNPADVSEALIFHTRVNSIADYYGVTGLAELSVDRIAHLLTEDWSADGFCDLLAEATGSTTDRNLRKTIVRAAASNVFELVGKDVFSKGKVANDIAAEVLMMSTEDPAKQKKNEDEIEAGKRNIASLEHILNEISTVLGRKCTGLGCKNTFGCILERPTQNEEKPKENSDTQDTQLWTAVVPYTIGTQNEGMYLSGQVNPDHLQSSKYRSEKPLFLLE
ncbi:hypothetical protein F4859DRAFT_514948 [Xylaria cf. heliscus]|nr:hypothetical protein F4859DRAFT_514948 [Xylaria cf. heliscus]